MDTRKSSAAHAHAQRLRTDKASRQGSATAAALEKALNDHVDLLQGDQLSDADRRLAELGYVQVCRSQAGRLWSPAYSTGNFRSINASSPGYPASLLLSRYRGCSLRSRRPTSIHSRLAACQVRFGAGSYPAAFACALPCLYQNLCLPTPLLEVSISLANTLRLTIGWLRSVGFVAGSISLGRPPA